MLITPTQLQHAITLDVKGVDAALKRAGYSDNRLRGVRFEGINTHGQFVYDTLFDNDDKESGIDTGRVFLQYVGDRVEMGVLITGELHGEF